MRIAYGNYQMLWRNKTAFLRPRLALPMLRKLLRTSGPVLLLVALLVASVGAAHPLLLFLAALGWAIAGIGVFAAGQGTAHSGPRVLRFVRLFATSQVAYLVGLMRFLLGDRDNLWRRSVDLNPQLLAPVPARVRVCKRALDIGFSLTALIGLLPVMLLLIVLIRLESPGPAVFKQKRLCPGGEFTMYKFRSMRQDAEAETGPTTAQEDDPRITRVGRYLRRFRMDEFPQFINILAGQMSLVGPRPERDTFAEQLEAQVPGFTDRHILLKPGLTGWAQVQAGYASTEEKAQTENKVAHDLAYIAHMYRWRDWAKMELTIIWLTVKVVLGGHGQ